MQKISGRLLDWAHTVWVLAAKDISLAIKNRQLVSIAILMGFLVFLPRILPNLFQRTRTLLPIYASDALDFLEDARLRSDFSLLPIREAAELEAVLCRANEPLIGLHFSDGFTKTIAAGEPARVQGYVCWGKRYQVAQLQARLEQALARVFGTVSKPRLQIQYVYPSADRAFSSGTSELNAVIIILMVGIFLVPGLIFEEKDGNTMQALLISPASTAQVLAGKALAGCFYALVSLAVVFTADWAAVIRWDLGLVFLITGSVFSSSLGVALGSIFGKQQDASGMMIVVLLLLVGAVLVSVLGGEQNSIAAAVLPWIPSVALYRLWHAIFSVPVRVSDVLVRQIGVVVVSLPLYVISVWKARHFDR